MAFFTIDFGRANFAFLASQINLKSSRNWMLMKLNGLKSMAHNLQKIDKTI
jgi:hypothetical protein